MERTVSLQRNSLKAGQPPSSPFGGEPEDDGADVQEVEMVLETYFMHIDNTYNKLQTLTEYIDDTEVFRLHLNMPFQKSFIPLHPATLDCLAGDLFAHQCSY